MYSKGMNLELKKSLIIHSKCVPLLICPIMLRRYGCGQVDIAGVYKTKDGLMIKFFEAKSSGNISGKQRQRLYNSASLVSSYLDIPCTVSVIR